LINVYTSYLSDDAVGIGTPDDPQIKEAAGDVACQVIVYANPVDFISSVTVCPSVMFERVTVYAEAVGPPSLKKICCVEQSNVPAVAIESEGLPPDP